MLQLIPRLSAKSKEQSEVEQEPVFSRRYRAADQCFVFVDRHDRQAGVGDRALKDACPAGPTTAPAAAKFGSQAAGFGQLEQGSRSASNARSVRDLAA